MRRFLKLQWMMVAVIIVGILTWGGPAFVRRTARRWTTCQDQMKLHAKEAVKCAALAKANKNRRPNFAAYMEKQAVFHASKGLECRRALNRPWQFLPFSYSQEWDP
jgi:hypothetical protein